MLGQGAGGKYLWNSTDRGNAACRQCVVNNRPCIKRVKPEEGDVQLVVVTLPQILRSRFLIKDNGYWITRKKLETDKPK